MRNVMLRKALALILTISPVLVVLGCGGSDRATAPTPLRSRTAQSLSGNWVLFSTANPAASAQAAIGRRVKAFTDRNWEIIETDRQTFEVLFRHGGTYTLNGEDYTETVEFANANTAYLIGQTFRFKITIDGHTFNQTGLDNPWSEGGNAQTTLCADGSVD